MLTEDQLPATDATAAAQPTDTTDLPAKLEQLKASATQQYSLKNYDAAADFYSEAADVQDQVNGEMSSENADLLYQYGRCLYHVAVSKSDVLGGKVASAEEPKKKKRKVAKAESSAAGASGGAISDALKDGEQKMAEEVVETVVDEKDKPKAEEDASSKPFFQITGDENWTDSEDDDDAADEEAEEEEDDFATAFEILDVARILLNKKLEALAQADGKAVTDTPEQRQLKERLADTHDLQAEISLENERFHDAINDTRDALQLKMQLFPEESSLVAEAHFKLSLALEFASVTSTEQGEPEDGGAGATPAQVDEELRKEAALEMEKAIASCKLRISKEEELLAAAEGSKKAEQQRSITDVKEMVADMEQRLVDLRNPAVSLSGMGGPAGAPDGGDPLQGVLGAMLGESKADQKKRLTEATEQANDLSGLVKHKKKPKAESVGEPTVQGKGKRKADDGDDSNGKKVKFENDA